MGGNHAPADLADPPKRPSMRFTVPFNAPGFILNPLSMGLFNKVFYHKQRRERVRCVQHYETFFHPLDAVGEWNKLYGRRGFYQYQCVVPFEQSAEPIREILTRIAESRQASFLAVLKVFGDRPAPGLLSFARPGVTLALDFPNKGTRTLDLLERLDDITAAAGGCVYPAKDARMSAERFRQYFPQWSELIPFVDPGFSSSFWRRVTA